MATSAFSLSSVPYPLQITGKKIGIAVSEWNHDITYALKEGAEKVLKDLGFTPDQIVSIIVPGTFELPLAAHHLFKLNCDAVICLGCVIKGDTPHFEYVCKAATDGILKMGLDYGKPCIFGVLTTNTQLQAEERAGGKLGNKGAEAAISAAWMLAAIEQTK